MKVFFSAGARENLLETVQYIARDKPGAAGLWAESIRKSVMSLSDFPRAGRIVPEYADEILREIIKGLYRIVYKIDEEKDAIIIVAVHHSRRSI
jgi:toxin ParE1/3/4